VLSVIIQYLDHYLQCVSEYMRLEFKINYDLG